MIFSLILQQVCSQQYIVKVKNRKIQPIAEIDEVNVSLRYMTPAGNKYTCPKKIEYSWQSIEDVLVVMPDPHLVNDCDIVYV